MDWTNVITYVVEAVVGLAITLLSTYATIWINKHIKDDKAKKYANELVELVSTAVSYVSQTFVDKAKASGNWNDETKKEALNEAIAKVNSLMSSDCATYLKENFGDVTNYIKTLIEAQIKKVSSNEQETTNSK